MSEKVLGFKNSDSYLAKLGEEGLAWEHYRVGKDKLVPVVSLEWLKNYCKTHQTIKDCVNRDDLIKAARKQAGEK